MNDQLAFETHEAISGLLPWYVNGTLGELERQRVDSHLEKCAVCREDALIEQRVYRSIAADLPVEYMPTASLKRLHARLDGLGAPAAHAPEAPASRPLPWPRVAAASIAVLAGVVSLVTADQWMQYRARRAVPAVYTTTTISAPRPRDEIIRAVFAPSITLEQLNAILAEAELRIISGPSEAGVYSLAAISNRPVTSSLALLRSHEAVRFAESTGAQANPSSSGAKDPGEPP
jgi:hypothetical protein